MSPLRDEDTGEPVLTAQDIAELAGIEPRTWHAYVARGQAPAPDGHLARTAWWLESTITDWLESRRDQT